VARFGGAELYHGDCRAIAPHLPTVDAVVTDPPYHLTDMTKRFGGAFGAPGPRNSDGTNHYQRLASGFMGQQWDGGDIAFQPKTWATIANVMRPGAFLVAFGGTRTYHRLTTAIEDAGFIIQDCIMWLFGSGFPKRRDMLKPAYEPIVLAYKPGGKRTLQVDECRIGTNRGVPASLSKNKMPHIYNGGIRDGTIHDLDPNIGRWPANICHDGSEEVLEGFPDAPGQLYERPKLPKKSNGIYGNFGEQEVATPHGDSGSAARFFYSAKADKEDRWGSRHPTVKPVELMKWLVPLVTPPGGLVLDPFAGSGTTGVAALATGRDCILIEREAQYIADIKERLAFYEGEGRHSVTVKNRNRKSDAGPLFATANLPMERGERSNTEMSFDEKSNA
jgi:site-specific DNA-methyltransferase (adenine-specific)